MILRVNPATHLKATIQLPASKSYSIRSFLTAACGGNSKIIRPSDCDDAKVALSVARNLGAKVTLQGRDVWKVQAGVRKLKTTKLNVKESGTVLRLLLPLVSLYGQKVTVVGEGTLKGRPNAHLTKALRKQGIKIRGTGKGESVPIQITGGHLKGGAITIDGSLSSQFISALMITCPLLPNHSQINIDGKKVVSSDYITMTRQVLKKAGIKVSKINERLYKINGGQIFKGLKQFTVPSDYGLAAFHLAAGALTNSQLVLKGALNDDWLQADGHIFPLLKKMGAKFRKTRQSIQIRGPFQLKGGDFSLKNCPDLVPIMSILALFAQGKTRLCDIQHARVKESDRISDLRKELLKTGARVREKKNELIIEPYSLDAGPALKNNVLLDPHNDHRLAMAFCVLGLKIGVRVKDIECVRKSYPGFVKDFKKLGAIIK